ncbi:MULTISPECIES: superoxide dismutase family protein [Cupriavidus]
MKHVRALSCLAAAGALAGALAGCSSMGIGGDSAVARLDAKSGTATQGTVTFTQRGDRVLVTADVSGLPPNTEHGFHVHEKGDCSSPDAMSAGGHFNPTGKPHGSMSMPDHHAGDINNLRADASGRAQASFELSGVTVAPGPTSVVGHAVVVHKDPDDYRTQPTGNSGGRVACGVIAKS